LPALNGLAAEPPDLEIEAAVITSALAGEVDPSVWTLEPEDFYSDDHKALWRGLLECRAGGLPLDHLTLANRLRERGLWTQAAGSFIEALRVDPVVANAGAYAELVKRRSVARRLGHVFAGLGAEALHGKISDWPEWLERAKAKLEIVPSSRFEVVSGRALDVRLPSREWLIRELAIKPGPVTLYAGSSDSAKTLTLQSLAVTVATCGLVWNRFETAHGKVLHIDYEQGRELTLFRYQRLALVHGVWDELWANLAIESSATKPYLDSAASLAELDRLIREGGYKLCIVDSLRAAFPSLDENDSKARLWLDKLKPISEAHGCSIIPICHARKPSKDEAGGAQASVRGSSSLYEAAQQVIILRREHEDRDSAIVVRPNKGRLGHRVPKFKLRIKDIPIPVEALSKHVAEQTNSEDIVNETGSLRIGLEVSVMGIKLLMDEIEEVKEKILYYVRTRHGISTRDLVRECGINLSTDGVFTTARQRLLNDGQIELVHLGKKEAHYIPETVRETSDVTDDIG